MTERKGGVFWRPDHGDEITVEMHFNTKVAAGNDFAHINGPGQALLLELVNGVITQLEGNGSLRRNDDFLRARLEDSGVMKIELLSKSGDWPHVIKVLTSLFKRIKHRLLSGWTDQTQYHQAVDQAAEKSRQRLLKDGDLGYFARQAIRVGNYIPRRREVRATKYNEAREYIVAVLSVHNCCARVLMSRDNELAAQLNASRQIVDDLWCKVLEPHLTAVKARYCTAWSCSAQIGIESKQLVEVEDCARNPAILYMRAQRLSAGYQPVYELLAMVFRELLADALDDHYLQPSINYSAGAMQIIVKRCDWPDPQLSFMAYDLKLIDTTVNELVNEIETRRTANGENYLDRFEKAKARVTEKIVTAGGMVEYRRRNRSVHDWCLDCYDAESWLMNSSKRNYEYIADLAMLNYPHLTRFAKMLDRSLCVVRVVNALNKPNAGVYRGHLSDIPVRVSSSSIDALLR